MLTGPGLPCCEWNFFERLPAASSKAESSLRSTFASREMSFALLVPLESAGLARNDSTYSTFWVGRSGSDSLVRRQRRISFHL